MAQRLVAEGRAVSAHLISAGIWFSLEVACAAASTWWLHGEQWAYFLGCVAGCAGFSMFNDLGDAWRLRKRQLA